MKKHLLILTSMGALMLGFTGFIKVLKTDFNSKKTLSSHSGTVILSPQIKYQLLPKPERISENQNSKVSPAEKDQLLDNISHLPLMFYKNMGQWKEAQVLYRSATYTAQVGFRKNGVTFVSFKELEEEHDEEDEEEEDNLEEGGDDVYETMVWNMNFKGMNSTTQLVAEGEVPGVTNFLLGNDSTKWVRNTPESRLLNYKGIYDHIDLHYYGIENYRLEYDFIVKPGGKIPDIQLELEGTQGLSINNKGELVIKTPWGNIAEAKPYSYQIINGVKKEIDIRYQILNDKTFGFKAYGSYDPNYDLVIDPKQLVWTTFTRGTGATYYVQDIAIDGNRNSYITGWAIENFPVTAGVEQATYGGDEDSYVCKFNRLGRTLVYATYLGGSARERGFAIVASSGGIAYVSGRTDSNDYPTFNAFDATQGSTDTFISALNTTGTNFIYSTYFGGTSSDKGGRDLFVNGANELFVTGMGKGSSFPTTAGVVRPAASADGTLDAFASKFSSTGTLLFSTLLGGSADDEGNGIYVNSAGEIFVTGQTKGSFPMSGTVYDNTHGGGNDAFVVKLNSTATSVIYSTYLGGGSEDIGYAIHVRGDEAYVTGITQGGFPTTVGAFRTAAIGGYDNFVTKINAAGNGLVYSTYLGGTLDENFPEDDAETGNDIVVNNNGEAYVSSVSLSTNFPVTNGYDLTHNTNLDGVISLLNASGNALLCATYIGGVQNDYKKLAMALDPASGAGTQDTLYSIITAHSSSVFDGGAFPVLETQGSVYSRNHINLTNDQAAVWKMYSCIVPPLPVELVSFKGSNKGDHNLLEWSTATEKNNDYFTIERSTDGINFYVIGNVHGAGNSENILHYSYSDSKEGNGVTYYRLVQSDLDGKTSYSDIIVINAPDNSKDVQLTISSPATDLLNYTVCCLQKGRANVEVLDMTGKVIISSYVEVNAGFNNLSLDSRSLASGSYVLKFSTNTSTVTGKFVK